MSGHSHWSTIKRKKQAEDQKRGKLFSRLSKDIALAAKSGGADLRLAIERAKSVNMPKENIERAIKRGKGEGERNKLEEVVYEGFGPEGVGVIVEATTDNRQRTTAEIKKIFERKGRGLAEPGAVSYQFQSKGLLIADKGENSQETILKIMDFDIEDVVEAEEGIKVYTKPKDLAKVRLDLEKSGLKIKTSLLIKEPLVKVSIKNKKSADRILELMDALEKHPDVQRTSANFNIVDNE